MRSFSESILHVPRINQIARLTSDSPINSVGIHTPNIDTCLVIAIVAENEAVSLVHDFGFNNIDFFNQELDFIQYRNVNSVSLHIAYNNPILEKRIETYKNLFLKKFHNSKVIMHPNCSFFTIFLNNTTIKNILPQFQGYTLVTSPHQEKIDEWCDLHAYAGLSTEFLMIYDSEDWIPAPSAINERLRKIALDVNYRFTKSPDYLKKAADLFPDNIGYLQALMHLENLTQEEALEKAIDIFFPYFQLYMYNQLKNLSSEDLCNLCCKDKELALVILNHDALSVKLGEYNETMYFNLSESINGFVNIFSSAAKKAQGNYLMKIALSHPEAAKYIKKHMKGKLSNDQIQNLNNNESNSNPSCLAF